MMLTLADALNLDSFKTFRLVAGASGLGKELASVGILDYEVDEVIEQNFVEGELVLTNLMGIKDDLTPLKDMIGRLNKVKVSGLAIKTIYVQEVPSAVIAYCDQIGFPLFLFENTFFEVIITSVSDAQKEIAAQLDVALQIDKLLSGNLNRYGVLRAAQSLSPGLNAWVMAVFVKAQADRGLWTVGVKPLMAGKKGQHASFPYRQGQLVLLSADAPEPERHQAALAALIAQLDGPEELSLGVSGLPQPLERLDQAIQEALYAQEAAACYGLRRLSYSEMGLDRLLLPIKDNPWAQRYCASVMDPIIYYDQKNGTELLKTAVVFVLSGGEIKRTAERLFQHGNTVRYRMDRIRQLLAQDGAEDKRSEWAFYEQLAVGVRLHLIYNGGLAQFANGMIL